MKFENPSIVWQSHGIAALEDERERIEARLRDFNDAEEAEEDSV